MIISENTLEKSAVIVIEPNEEETRKVRRILKEAGIEDIAIINIRCLNTEFSQIRELLTNNRICLKIFHSGSVENFDNMLATFGLQGGEDKDVIYVNTLRASSIIISYWKYRLRHRLVRSSEPSDFRRRC